MFVILQKYDFSSKSQQNRNDLPSELDVCDTAKVRFFKQITTKEFSRVPMMMMFVILQKYDFSSKSQLYRHRQAEHYGCLWYCKSTIFQANHNQLQTIGNNLRMFVILQKYDFSSKSQLFSPSNDAQTRCLWYCKSTIFQANHNDKRNKSKKLNDVCDTAKVRFFKQITTTITASYSLIMMFVILQKYDFSSKSQPYR